MTAVKNIDTVKTIERYLAVGTPIILVDSADHPHVRDRIRTAIQEKGAKNGGPRPLILWNVASDFVALNDPGKAALADIDQMKLKAAQGKGAAAALQIALDFQQKTVLIVDNLHWYWDAPVVKQCLQNLRDPFKSTGRAIIGLTLGGTLPVDLQQDCSFVEDPLPSEVVLAEKVKEIVGEVSDEDATLIGRELRGASPFRAEQLTAQSLTAKGEVDRDRLRDNARKQINDTPGLSVESTGETFDDIGGLDAIREFMRRYFSGPCRPDVVVRIEELEKALAGSKTESSGTSGDALGVLLTEMEDNGWTGCLAYGVSGCGKSLIAKAAANEFGAKAIRFDLNACKGSLVGQSEQQIRQATSVLKAIGGSRVFFIASMNEIESLPPELRARFTAGTWYFDVPSAASRANIFKMNAKRFGVELDGYDAAQLTGRDVRDIVRRQYELGCSTTEAAKYHVPLVKSAPDAIAKSRQQAEGRYLCAEKGGPYSSVEDRYSEPAKRRKISVEA